MKKKNQKKIILTIPVILFTLLLIPQQISAQVLPGQAPDFLWAQRGGGNGYDGASDITVDNAGNIIVTGYFDSTATFGNYTLNSAGASDIYIAKYSNAGDVLWAVSAGGSGYDQGYSVTTDNLGNIIICGIFSNSALFGGTVTLNSFGNYDIFTAKYSTNGVFQWVRQGGGQSYDWGYEVTADNQNNIIVTGVFYQFASFGNFTVQSGNPYGDIYVVKYNSAGTEQWVNAAYNVTGGQSFYNDAYGVRTDNNDNVFITGSFSNVINFGDSTLVSSFDGTNSDIFLAKYDSQGNFIWVAQAGSDSSGAYSNGNDIRIDEAGNIIFTGTFSTQAIFGNLPPLTASQNSDIFIAKYDQSGNALWAVQDYASIYYNEGREIDLDAAGNISLIASVSQDITFGELNDVYFARFTGTGQKLWGTRAGLINGNDAGGIVNDAAGDIYGCGNFYISGIFGSITLNGINGEAFVVKLPSPKFVTNPNPLDFGSVVIGNPVTVQVAFSNISTANLHVFNITAMNDTSGSFGINSGLPLDSITANQSVNLGFGFTPFYPGFKDAFFEIVSDASTSPDTIFVSGTGIIPGLALSASVLDFGTVDVGIVSNQTVSLINSSVANILLDSVRITGTDASDFTFTPPVDGDTVFAQNFLNLNVSFSPDTSGMKSAYLIIYSTAFTSPDSVLLTGTGLSSIIVQVPSSPSMGEVIPLNITPPASSLFTTADIYYRRTGESLYQQGTLSNQGNDYTFTIPAEYSTITGIQFYVIFSDGSTTVTYPSLNPDLNPASIQVSIPQIFYPVPIKLSQYQMFSIPLSINSPQIDSVFQDDYGIYDPSVWRIFRWNPQANEYNEYNSIAGNIVPGNAFWLINRTGKSFDIENSQSVSSFNTYTITVQPGYNQISNPFAFPVNWTSIENSNLLLQAPIHWNADSQDYELDSLTLEPWEGYWVFNDLNTLVNLIVSPNPSLGKKQSSNHFASLKSDEFLVQIQAFLKSSGAKDRQNYVAMIDGATDGFDKFDVIKPPPIKDDIKLLIESGKDYYARNAVPVSNEGAYWDFKVETESSDQLFRLVVNKISALPDKFNIWVLDRDFQIPLDISSGSAELVSQGNGSRNLRIIIGTEEYAKAHSENISLQPYEYALYQNYPNPFNPSTNIIYQLKEKESVTLEIFDILGRRIKSIINNTVQNPGQHIATWNGTNNYGEKVASGIYIYRIRAKDFISSRKMILLK